MLHHWISPCLLSTTTYYKNTKKHEPTAVPQSNASLIVVIFSYSNQLVVHINDMVEVWVVGVGLVQGVCGVAIATVLTLLGVAQSPVERSMVGGVWWQCVQLCWWHATTLRQTTKHSNIVTWLQQAWEFSLPKSHSKLKKKKKKKKKFNF